MKTKFTYWEWHWTLASEDLHVLTTEELYMYRLILLGAL